MPESPPDLAHLRRQSPEAAAAKVRAARRILVLGSSGAGKTALARALAELLGLEPIHLDAHFFAPGWVPTPVADWRLRVEALAQRPAWVMDGTYEESLELRLPYADLVILMDSWRVASLARVILRALRHGARARPDAPSGQRLDWLFVRYIWRFPVDSMPLVMRRLAQHAPRQQLVVLGGPAGARRLLARLDAGHSAGVGPGPVEPARRARPR